jgi:hypothetical protein
MGLRFRGTRAELLEKIRQLPERASEPMRQAIGLAALSEIKDAFVVKATGGTDEMGIQWKPLAPSTIAARRVGPRDREQSQLIRDRERIRKRETKKALSRFQLSLPEREALRRARIVGGLKATRETGKTKLETLGGRQVEILRDTGVLLNSLSPGTLEGEQYTKPEGEGGEEQIFELGDGYIAVGTNVAYAGPHQHGTKHIPARPFLPDEDHPVPQIWWDRWLGVAVKVLAIVARREFV